MFKQPTYKAFVISASIFLLLVIGLFNTYIKEPIEEVTFSIEYAVEEEKTPSIEETEKNQLADKAKLETHRAYNEAEKNIARVNQEMKNSNQEFEEHMQAMQQAIKESNTQSFIQDGTLVEAVLPSRKVIHNENVDKHSSISYHLLGRYPINLPNPVYTCYNDGTIVINITVNNIGEVINSVVDNSKSTSSDRCLKDRALEYASQTRFNITESSSDNQMGTITYSFIGS